MRQTGVKCCYLGRDIRRHAECSHHNAAHNRPSLLLATRTSLCVALWPMRKGTCGYPCPCSNA